MLHLTIYASKCKKNCGKYVHINPQIFTKNGTEPLKKRDSNILMSKVGTEPPK